MGNSSLTYSAAIFAAANQFGMIFRSAKEGCRQDQHCDTGKNEMRMEKGDMGIAPRKSRLIQRYAISAVLGTGRVCILVLQPACMHVMGDYAVWRHEIAVGDHLQSRLLSLNSRLAGARGGDGERGLGVDLDVASHPSPLLFFLAATAWAVSTAIYCFINNDDKYQRHVLLLAGCIGIAAATITGMDFTASCFSIVPWCLYLGLFVSDLGHLAARACLQTENEYMWRNKTQLNKTAQHCSPEPTTLQNGTIV
jgi:hypothetical protein